MMKMSNANYPGYLRNITTSGRVTSCARKIHLLLSIEKSLACIGLTSKRCRLLYSLIFIFSGSLLPSANAGAVSGTCGEPGTTISYLFNAHTFTASPTAAIGSLIGNELTSSPSAKVNVTTGRPPFYYFATPTFSVVSGVTYKGAKVYQTTLSGVGLAMWGESYTSGPLALLSNTTTAGTYTGTFHYALVKTAANVSPGLVSFAWASKQGLQCLNTSGATVQSPVLSEWAWFGAVTIISPACYVSNTAINVPLGDVKRTLFTGAGSTSAAQSFTIPLVCSRATKISMTLSPGASGTYNASTGVLNIDPATSGIKATGVGIQLLHNNAVAALNTAFDVGSASAAGTVNIPLSARYYQTAASVTAGQANGTATFTVTYN